MSNEEGIGSAMLCGEDRGRSPGKREDSGGLQGGAGAGVVQRVKMSLEVSTVMLPEKWLNGLR